MEDVTFNVVDYIVMALFLAVSLAIGVYYGFFKKQKTTEEYIMGNRHMHLLPVTLSLLVTYQSSISVMGIPVEVYMYNTMALYLYVAIVTANVIQAFFIVPLVYPLKLTSAYEYLGRRYRSRSVQLLGALVGMLQTVLYMAVVLFAPALALEAVAGMPLWISIIAIGVIGTAYTCVGGIKSVIWTDTFQFIILYGGLLVILIMGSIKVGGIGKIWTVSRDDSRIELGNINLDPRIRHTVWSCLIGGIFNWLPNCCNQSAIQRICAMRSERDAKIAVLLNVPLMLLYGCILLVTGLVLYTYFRVFQCDPLSAGYITNANQMMPYFVTRVLNDVPGLAGLFIAALFSGALSSLSSGINSMSANTIQDLLVDCLNEKSQVTKTLIAKLFDSTRHKINAKFSRPQSAMAPFPDMYFCKRHLAFGCIEWIDITGNFIVITMNIDGDEYIRVVFRIRQFCRDPTSEHVGLIGSHPALSDWKSEHGLLAKYIGLSSWQLEIMLPKHFVLKYKLCLYHPQHMSLLHTETCGEHELKIGADSLLVELRYNEVATKVKNMRSTLTDTGYPVIADVTIPGKSNAILKIGGCDLGDEHSDKDDGSSTVKLTEVEAGVAAAGNSPIDNKIPPRVKPNDRSGIDAGVVHCKLSSSQESRKQKNTDDKSDDKLCMVLKSAIRRSCLKQFGHLSNVKSKHAHFKDFDNCSSNAEIYQSSYNIPRSLIDVDLLSKELCYTVRDFFLTHKDGGKCHSSHIDIGAGINIIYVASVSTSATQTEPDDTDLDIAYNNDKNTKPTTYQNNSIVKFGAYFGLGLCVVVAMSILNKTHVCLYGILTVALAYLAQNLSGPVSQIALTAMGACGGPVTGIMFLGAAFPQANWIGALSGGITGMALNIWLAVGSVLYGNKAPKSEPVSTDGCFTDALLNKTVTTSVNESSYSYVTSSVLGLQNTTLTSFSSVPVDEHLAIYDMSYLYLGLVGFLIAFVVGLLVSLATGMDRGIPTESEYIFPCMRGFWRTAYTAVATPSTYKVTKVTKKSQKNGKYPYMDTPQIAPIKALDMSWFNKQADDAL